jgi:hypothetical protein
MRTACQARQDRSTSALGDGRAGPFVTPGPNRHDGFPDAPRCDVSPHETDLRSASRDRQRVVARPLHR